MLTTAVWCRRQPFNSTSVWSGDSPRSVNGRWMSVASVTLWCGKLTDGATAWRIWLVSVVPCRASSALEYTSTGTASSSAAVCRACDPTTTSIGASPIAWAWSAKFWSTVCPPATMTCAVACT